LSQRTGEDGVTSYFNRDGDVLRVEDPANALVKVYALEKYATGALKRKTETVTVTAKNVEGTAVSTTAVSDSFYDEKGRLSRFVDASDGETLYTYTTAGETESIVYPDGKRILYSYVPDTVTGSRAVTETHQTKNTQGDVTSYADESMVIKIYNSKGELTSLSERVTGETSREEVTYTYEYYPGADRKLKRQDAIHRFVQVQDGSEIFRYATFEERSEAGLVTRSRDDRGVWLASIREG